MIEICFLWLCSTHNLNQHVVRRPIHALDVLDDCVSKQSGRLLHNSLDVLGNAHADEDVCATARLQCGMNGVQKCGRVVDIRDAVGGKNDVESASHIRRDDILVRAPL